MKERKRKRKEKCGNQVKGTRLLGSLTTTMYSNAESKIAPAKKGGEKKKGHSAINEVVTQEYTISFHKCIHGVGFKKGAPWALKEILKFAMMEMGNPDVHIDTRLNKAAWAKGIRNVPYRICVQLSRKHNEDEDSPNKLYTLSFSIYKATLLCSAHQSTHSILENEVLSDSRITNENQRYPREGSDSHQQHNGTFSFSSCKMHLLKSRTLRPKMKTDTHSQESSVISGQTYDDW
ncbi:60S ribosomal protein L31 [Plecturocebus cupreus]